MTQMIVLPHRRIVPGGHNGDRGDPGTSICQTLLENGSPSNMPVKCPAPVPRAPRGRSRRFSLAGAGRGSGRGHARQGLGLEPNSRLSCQALVADEPLVVEIPRYSINMAREGKH